MKVKEQLANALSRLRFTLARAILWRFRKPRYFVMLGGPGAGKGTLSVQLAPALGVAHLSTGDVFRREIASKTKLGLLAKSYIDAGTLVPDQITAAMVARELQRPRYWHGAIFDGFPRTLTQARMLDEMLQTWGSGVERAVLLDLDEGLLIWRLANRRTCSNKSCGRTYHLQSKPPQVADTCDACKSPLYQRSDDVPEAISERLSTYKRESSPVCEHYAGKLLFVKPTKETTEQDVFSMVRNALRARREPS